MKVRFLWIGVVVLFIAGVLLTASSFAKLDLKTCVGMWLFDEGSGTTAKDSSGNKNDGTLMNGPKWVGGKFGKALEFNGSAYADCGRGANLSITKTITVQAWVEFGGSPSSAIIISKYGKSGSGLSYMLVINGDGGAPGKASFYLSGWRHFNTQINDSHWHHLAATVSSKAIDLYVDGKLDSALGGVPTISASDSTVTIGAPNSNGWGTFFNGLIDEVAVFNVALLEEDILTLMKKGLKKTLITAVFPSGKLTTTWAVIKAH
jgi:hypothetical protein